MKNNCPYLKNKEKCTHKKGDNRKHKKTHTCTYNNELKCPYYNDYAVELESFIRMANMKSELQSKDRMT